MPKLDPTTQAFVLHWGEMGTRWGINRTVAQIHALLLLSPEPLPAGTIAETLGVARSNVSNSLRELQGWDVVKVVHVLGDRRDHYEALHDPWEMFPRIIDERKKRECDPTLTTLRELVKPHRRAGVQEAYAQQRLAELLAFYETITTWYTQVRSLPTRSILKLMKLGAKVRKFLGPGA